MGSLRAGLCFLILRLPLPNYSTSLFLYFLASQRLHVEFSKVTRYADTPNRSNRPLLRRSDKGKFLVKASLHFPSFVSRYLLAVLNLKFRVQITRIYNSFSFKKGRIENPDYQGSALQMPNSLVFFGVSASLRETILVYLTKAAATPPSTFRILPVDLPRRPPTKANTPLAISLVEMISFKSVRLA